MHGERALREQGRKLLRGNAMGRFAPRFCRAGNDPAGDFHAGGSQLLTGSFQDGILPGP